MERERELLPTQFRKVHKNREREGSGRERERGGGDKNERYLPLLYTAYFMFIYILCLFCRYAWVCTCPTQCTEASTDPHQEEAQYQFMQPHKGMTMI